MARSKEEIFANGLALSISRYRQLNEGQKLDALPLADSICDDADKPIDILPILESMVRNIVWTRAQREARIHFTKSSL